MPTPPKLLDSLLADTLAAITLRQRRSLALLGYSELTHQLLGALNAQGCEALITGVFDPRSRCQGAGIGSHIVAPVEMLLGRDVDLVCVCADDDKEDVLRAYAELTPEPIPEVILVGDGHFAFRDPLFDSLTEKKLVKSTATGSPNTLIHLYQCLRSATKLGAHGTIVEFGMYKGGTTVMLAKMAAALELDSRVIGFDAFAGFPGRRSVLDLYADPVCEFTNFEEVRRYCEPHGIEIVAGDINETYHRLKGVPLLLSFFDTDNYSPTKAALPLCIEQTVRGGSIVFDHVYSTEECRYTLGERIAACELLDDTRFFHLHATGVFTRID